MPTNTQVLWIREYWLQSLAVAWVVLSIMFPLWLYEHQARVAAEVGDDLMLKMAEACNSVVIKNPRHTTRWVVFDVYAPVRGRQIICNDAKAIWVPVKEEEPEKKKKRKKA